MRYAIVSDLHANETAFRAVLADAAEQGADEVVCLGDVVGYGPLPAETVALVREHCTTVLAGNHDDAVSGRGDASTFIDLAADAVKRHREALSADDLEWLKDLPYTAELDGAVASHGDFTDPTVFYYIDEEADAIANFNAIDAQLAFVGHTHVPALFLTGRSGNVYKTAPQDFTLEDDKRYIVNPGSVGYPRESEGQCYSSYVIYDSEEKTVSFRFLPFSVASVLQRGTGLGRLSKKLVAALLVIVAAVVAAAVYFLTPKTELLEDPELIVEKRELALGADAKHVKANLTLAKESAAVTLEVDFIGPSNELLSVETRTVRKSSAADLRVPDGAVRAEFKAKKNLPVDPVYILLFAPSASSK